MTAWVVRAGRNGEDEQWNLEQGRATIRWSEIGDLTNCHSREGVRTLVDAAFPGDATMRRANQTGQLWAFRDSIKIDDLVVMPLKTRPGYLAFGRCAGTYAYDAAEPNKARRHHLPVTWQTEAIAKSGMQDDLLYMLNASMTVFSPSRNNAAERLDRVAQTGADPGGAHDTATASAPPSRQPSPSLSRPADDVTDPATVPTLEAVRDRIRTHLVQHFREHDLTHLVAQVLEALGFVCEVSPAGPDGGVDILAGRGPFGLDSPTLIVEVKSEPGAVGSSVLRGLHSAMTQHKADQGLLVAYGGVSLPARKEFRQLRTQLRIWDAEELLEQLFGVYDKLPPATRAAIPLKQAWVLDDDE
ncbi:MAG: restriction endonuclease [Tomitella sp.]|uniref:restriction endonuclease n=1 Tax=Intrasporangium sp. TaxID=1925024 RepID=UPI002647B08A|nr:restriction endonuclease [Intrasporangium sp.]MDN5759545.1 restriction endonuclease [Tomitella sp.]MDN5796250.1 restriction endonuclease [Intrasporangium sp.]